MNHPYPCNLRQGHVTRRNFLWQLGGGLGGLALTSLLAESRLLRGAMASAAPVVDGGPAALAARAPHFAPRAKRVIQIFCPGGMSQVDTWDYKPGLAKRAGKPFDPTGKLQFFGSKPGNCQPSFWPFRQYGQSGRWMSSLFPRLSNCVDDMAFVYSMTSKTALHGPGCFMMNTGFILPGFPSMGAWVTYGLGCETQNLPAFVVLPDPRGLPPGGPVNWGAGFLPAVHQGTAMETAKGRDPVYDLFPPAGAPDITPAGEVAGRDFLRSLNVAHGAQRPGDSELDARITAYELAARLQLSAPEVTDLAGETKATRELYCLDHKDAGSFGRQCLMARRLVERGVRFVQIYCGAENMTVQGMPRPNWDSHEDLVRDHGYWGPILDSGAAALLTDLKSRGLLDDTLVMCMTEFGRQPAAQGMGRDHNPGAFTVWLAGGGIKPGMGYGSSDELGYRAADNPTYCYDIHATALHLLGLHHEKLSFYHNGIYRRLTDVHGRLIHDLIA